MLKTISLQHASQAQESRCVSRVAAASNSTGNRVDMFKYFSGCELLYSGENLRQVEQIHPCGPPVYNLSWSQSLVPTSLEKGSHPASCWCGDEISCNFFVMRHQILLLIFGLRTATVGFLSVLASSLSCASKINTRRQDSTTMEVHNA